LGCLHSAIGAAKLKIVPDLGKKNPSLFEGLAPDRIKASGRVFASTVLLLPVGQEMVARVIGTEALPIPPFPTCFISATA